MTGSNYNTLVARGRKAGLSTRDLYAALGALPPEDNEGNLGKSDGNGYAAEIDENGHRVFRPVQEEGR